VKFIMTLAALVAAASPANAALSLADLRAHVKYVFVLYQENRSFDSYFGTYPGAEGLFSNAPAKTPGFVQTLLDTDGSMVSISPFRIGPELHAADTDDVDHSHPGLVAKMHVVDGSARMDRFAASEEERHTVPGHPPSLQAKQFGELTMAYADCDTVPILWNYAQRFVLFDHIFQSMTGPSTPGNLAILGAQAGDTELALHPQLAYSGDGAKGAGLPVVDDADPHWGSPRDVSVRPRLPVNPSDFARNSVQYNLTYAALPLTLAGATLADILQSDRDPAYDLADVIDDARAITVDGAPPVPWGWYQEGYDQEPTERASPTPNGSHASYVTHHNGPQYFGYIANNPRERRNLYGLQDFFDALTVGSLPSGGGVYYVKGGSHNLFELKPTFPDPNVQKDFLGDDDHPGYSDAQISEALVAQEINAIAHSKYWPASAIVLTWDDSEGDYDHVAPPLRSFGPDGSVTSDGPRVPLLLISPYAKTGTIVHASGDHGSVVKFVDELFGRTALADLPDERKALALGRTEFGRADMGPDDGPTSGVTDLTDAFDPDRLRGSAPPLTADYASVDDSYVSVLPQKSGLSCETLGIVPVDRARGVESAVPHDFNPRPSTDPSRLISRR
jgi:phospholipase C